MSPATATLIRTGIAASGACTLLSIAYVAAQLFEWLGILGSTGGPNAVSTPTGIAWLLLPSLLLGPAYVVMIAALHQTAEADRRVHALAALAFAIMYATLTGLVYFVQLTFVAPRLAAGDTSGIELLLFVPYRSFLFAIDLFGYSLMCLSCFFAGLALRGRVGAKAASLALLLNGLILPALALQMFVPQLIWLGALWAILFPAATALLWRFFLALRARPA